MSADSPTAAVAAEVVTDPPTAAAAAAGRGVPWREVWVGIIALAAAAATGGLLIRGNHGAGLFIPVLCLGAVALAAGLDAATGRIPNPLTYTAILLGLGVNAAAVALHAGAPRLAAHWLGGVGPTEALLGLLVFGGIGMVCRLLAGMGGGDMKLLAAVGALLGLSRAAEALTWALAVAVVYAVINLAIRGRLNATVRAAAVQMLNLVYLRDPTPAPLPSRKTVPLAVPIFLGLLVAKVPQAAAAWAWLRGG